MAYVIAASTALLGRTEFALHFPALLFSVLTSAALYHFSLELFPGRRELAWWSVVLCNVTPLFGLGAVFTTPDAPSTFLWISTAFLVWRAVHGSHRLWYLAGATSGLGLLSKYTFVLLPLSVFVFLLHPQHRGWWRRREPYLAFAVLVLLFVPVLAWNANHHWASFAYHLVWQHGYGAFRPWSKVARFFVAQQSLSPLLWVACVAALVRSYRLGRAGSDEHWYLFCCSAVPLAFFAAWSPFAWVNPNWFAMAFLTLLVPTADLLGASRSWVVRIAPVGLAAALTLAFYLQAVSLIFPIPPTLDLASDLHGWEEVGRRLREIRGAMPRPDRVFVFSCRLQFSALAAFYGGDDLEVTRLGGTRDQYDVWTPPGLLHGKDAIFFRDDHYYFDPPGPYFHACEAAGTLPIVRRGRTLRTFSFYRCWDYQL